MTVETIPAHAELSGRCYVGVPLNAIDGEVRIAPRVTWDSNASPAEPLWISRVRFRASEPGLIFKSIYVGTRALQCARSADVEIGDVEKVWRFPELKVLPGLGARVTVHNLLDRAIVLYFVTFWGVYREEQLFPSVRGRR